jgi:hypothetical protein
MPLGVITEEELLAELNGSKTTTEIPRALDKSIVDIPSVGRPADRPNIPDVVKKVIAEAKLDGASNKELIAAFNVSAPTINAASQGMSSSDKNATENPALTDHVKKVKTRIIKRASSKLMTALGEITPEKLSDCSARDNAAIAKDMSQIIRNMEPKEFGDGPKNAAQFIFMAPQQKPIDAYEVVTVQD